MVRVQHRQLITTINVIRNLLPVTRYISPSHYLHTFQAASPGGRILSHFSASQLANPAYVIQFSFLILSGIILLTYVFSLLSCRIIYIKSHRYTFLIIWFRYFRIPERLLPSPGILSGYPSSAISHQRSHVSPEVLRGTGGHPSFHIPSLSVAYPVHIYRCRLIFHKSTSGFLCLIIQC